MEPNKCEVCGGELEYRREGSTQGYFCKNCDWAVVTTYIPEIEMDDTCYEIRVANADYENASHIKAVSAVSGLNFLATRKLLQTRAPVVFRGMATEAVRVRAALAKEGLNCSFSPEFPY